MNLSRVTLEEQTLDSSDDEEYGFTANDPLSSCAYICTCCGHNAIPRCDTYECRHGVAECGEECFSGCGKCGILCYDAMCCRGEMRVEDMNAKELFVNDEQQLNFKKYCKYPREACEPCGGCLKWCRTGIYGNDEAEEEEGRCCIWKVVIDDLEWEHYIFCIEKAMLSLADQVLDLMLILKWGWGLNLLGENREPRVPEAWLLFFIWMFANLTSFMIAITWKREDKCKCYPSSFMHLIGLGVVAEAWNYRHDHEHANPMKNLGPYRWTEILMETCPALMLTLYVAAQEGLKIEGEFEFSLEIISILLGLILTSYSLSQALTQDVPRAMEEMRNGGIGFNEIPKGYAQNIGKGKLQRMFSVLLLTLTDMILRSGAVVMFVVFFDDDIRISLTWMAIIFVSIEGFVLILNGEYYDWCLQPPFILYVGFFQGTTMYLSKRWEMRQHFRTVLSFLVRYAGNLTIFLWMYLSPSHANKQMNDAWFYAMCVSAGMVFVLFFLKPETLTIFEVHRRLRLAYKNQEIAMSTIASAKRKLKRMGTTMQSVLTDASNFVRKPQEEDDSSYMFESDLEASSNG